MSVDIADLASELLGVSGIERVVSIDDDYSEDSSPVKLLAVLNVVEDRLLEEKIGPLVDVESGDRDLIRDRIANDWAALDDEVKSQLIQHLTPPEEETAEGQALADDLEYTSDLPGVFGDKLTTLTLKQWEEQKEQIVSAGMPPTLLLVDLRFSKESRGDEGLRIIAELLLSHPEDKIYCGLLTSTSSLKTVHSDWKSIADNNELSRDRFVLIPKDSLRTDKRQFLSLLKLAVMVSPAKQLCEAVKKAYVESAEFAAVKLDALDVYEFERIVCLSSSTEGVWEPDTLQRIFTLFHKTYVRQALRGDAQVHDLADRLRNLTNVKVGEWGGPTAMEIAVRRLEWFDDAEDINERLLPLELGDLFEVADRPEKRYVLVAQPCDLMVRQNGDRHRTVKLGLLLEASPVSPEEPDAAGDSALHFSLDFFEANQDWRINLRKVRYIPLEILDLCTFRKDGESSIWQSDVVPSVLSAAWKARFPKVKAALLKSHKKFSDMGKIQGLKQADLLKLASPPSTDCMIGMTVDVAGGIVSFNIKRVGRLKQPRAGALLSRYASSLNRDAFDHDLTSRPTPLPVGDFGDSKA